MASPKIADTFTGDEDSTFRHLITFGGNPASCAAGLANLEIMENEGMVENSAAMGDYLFDQLQTLYEHPIVGDVRGGMGLIAAVELVKDRDTREKFPKEAGLASKMRSLLKQHGLLTREGDTIFMAPPLCITREEVDHMVGQVDEVVGELERML